MSAEHAEGAGEHALTPASYIQHHLTFNTQPVGPGGFWTINVDTIATSILLGVVVFSFMAWVVHGATAGVPGKRQAFVEVLVEWVNQQVHDIFHKSFEFVAPL